MKEHMISFGVDVPVTRSVDEIIEEAAGRRMVAFGGTFDFLHRGHMSLISCVISHSLERPAKCFVIALVPDDQCVLVYKGSLPSTKAEDRATALALIPGVDAAFIHEDQPPVTSIMRLGVHTLWKGKDYAGKEIPEMAALRRLETDHGDKTDGRGRETIYCDHGEIHSCTSIRNSIKRAG